MDQTYRITFFEYTNLLKHSVNISDEEKKIINRDYLSKEKNVEKYIYEACEAIQIAGISYIKYERDISHESNEKLNKGMGAICGRNYEIEAHLAYRRILELFIESLFFSKIDKDREKNFRYFYLMKNLKSFYSRNKNSEDTCKLPLNFDKKVISEIRQQLNEIHLAQIPFYIVIDKNSKKPKDFNKDNNSIFHLLKGYSDLFEEAIVEFTQDQRLIAGESYQSYSATSEVIHGYSGGAKFNLEHYHEEVLGIYAKIYLLSLHILKHLVDIGNENINNIDLINSIREIKTDIGERFILNIGDSVLVKNEVKAKIVDVSTTEKGCKKYKVEYQDNSGNSNISFENKWFLFKDLQKF